MSKITTSRTFKYVQPYSFFNKPFLFLKIISIIGFFFLVSCLYIILETSSAQFYEYSIYDVYPWYFWFFIIMSIFSGQFILINSALFKYRRDLFIYGFTVIILSNSILLFMPFIRGYLIFGDGDVLTHIGFMTDILNTYHIGSNPYPMEHILGTVINLVANIAFNYISMLIPSLFSLFFILSCGLLGRQIFEEKGEVVLLIIFSSILLFGTIHSLFTPFHQSSLIIPFILFLFFKRFSIKQDLKQREMKFSFILVIFCIFIALFHPLTTLCLSIIFLISEFVFKFMLRTSESLHTQINTKNLNLILLTIFSIWSSYLYLSVQGLESIVEAVTGAGTSESQLQQSVNIVAKSDASFFTTVKVFLSVYGSALILGLLSLLCIFILAYLFRKFNVKIRYYYIFSSLGFAFFSLLSIFLLVSNNSFSFIRIYLYSELFSLILIASTFYLVYKNIKFNKNYIHKLFCLLLILMLYFSLFSLYFSPIVKRPNSQVTKSYFMGMKSFYENRNESMSILELGISNFRYYDAIYGVGYPGLNINATGTAPVEHFNYINDTSFGKAYNHDVYFLLTDQGLNFYPIVYPEFRNKWKFTPSDFHKLNSDSSINSIYTNGGIDVFFINEDQNSVCKNLEPKRNDIIKTS